MTNKIIYWISTGLLSLLMIVSSIMYLVKTEMVQEIFQSLGYPSRIVIPLATLKILGIIAIVSNKNNTLKEWAYFGFLIDFSLAIEGHLAVKDGGHITATVALLLLMISYTFNKKVYPSVSS